MKRFVPGLLVIFTLTAMLVQLPASRLMAQEPDLGFIGCPESAVYCFPQDPGMIDEDNLMIYPVDDAIRQDAIKKSALGVSPPYPGQLAAKFEATGPFNSFQFHGVVISGLSIKKSGGLPPMDFVVSIYDGDPNLMGTTSTTLQVNDVIPTVHQVLFPEPTVKAEEQAVYLCTFDMQLGEMFDLEEGWISFYRKNPGLIVFEESYPDYVFIIGYDAESPTDTDRSRYFESIMQPSMLKSGETQQTLDMLSGLWKTPELSALKLNGGPWWPMELEPFISLYEETPSIPLAPWVLVLIIGLMGGWLGLRSRK